MHQMQRTKRVEEYEKLLGTGFPTDYRAALLSGEFDRSTIEYSLEIKAPGNGLIDFLLTPEELLENAKLDSAGIPEEGLVIIGGNMMSGYVYLNVSKKNFGQVHYRELYSETENQVFQSFSSFLASCGKVPW
jgi:hypothetical protein